MADKNKQKKNKGVENNRKWRQGLLRNGGKEGKDKETRKKKILTKLQAYEKRWRDEKLLGSTAKLLFSLDMTKPEKWEN